MNIALLIDADNTPPNKMESILRLLLEQGRVPVRRAYGNWSKEQLSGWIEITKKLSIKQEQQPDYVSGKNATDMALVIAALDLLHKGHYDAFAIVSSDSDYTPLAVYLREAGVQVFGFGKEHTPEALRSSCDTFVILEEMEPLTPPAIPEEPTPTPLPTPKPRIALDEEEVHSALAIAAETACDPTDGYTQLSEAGTYLHHRYPGAKLYYAGHTKLQCFVAAHTGRYHIHKKHKLTRYRCLPHPPAANELPPAAPPCCEEEKAAPHVPARVHLWLRQIHETSTTPDGFSTMGHTSHCLRKLARAEGTEFNVKHYGFAKLITLIKNFPKLYEVREEKRNSTTVYAYKCRNLPQKLA